MGSIHKDKRTGKYFIMYDTVPTEGRKRRQRKKSGFPSMKEAKKALVEVESSLHKGLYFEPTRMLYGEFLLEWLEKKRSAVRSQTLENYSCIVKRKIAPKLGKMQLSQLSPRHLQHFINESLAEGLSESYVVKIYTVLNNSLLTAYKWKLIPDNPMECIDKPRIGRKEQHVWDRRRLNTFLEKACSDRLYVAFFLAMTTGLRRGEILGLRWKDVDMDNQVLNVCQILSNSGKAILSETKTASSRRIVDLPVEAVNLLRSHRHAMIKERLEAGPEYRDHDLVICTSKGTPVNPRNMLRSFKRITKAAGLPEIRFHDLRHSHATLLIENGADIKMIAERLGHSTTRITLDTYVHVRKGRQKEAADIVSSVLFNKVSEA